MSCTFHVDILRLSEAGCRKAKPSIGSGFSDSVYRFVRSIFLPSIGHTDNQSKPAAMGFTPSHDGSRRMESRDWSCPNRGPWASPGHVFLTCPVYLLSSRRVVRPKAKRYHQGESGGSQMLGSFRAGNCPIPFRFGRAPSRGSQKSPPFVAPKECEVRRRGPAVGCFRSLAGQINL